MRLLRSLGAAGWSYRGAFGRLAAPTMWLPFCLVAATQLLLVVFFTSFHRPVLALLGVPVIKGLAGEAATHYPTLYVALPGLFARGSLVVGVLVSSLATGVTTLLFARAYGHPTGAPWATAVRRYGGLLLLAVAAALVSVLIFLAARLVPTDLYLGDRAVRWGTRFGALGLFVILQALLVYATAWFLLGGRGVVAALGSSVRMAGGALITTLLVVAIPVALLFPLEYLTERADLVLGNFRPEVMTWLLVIRIVVELVLSILLVGAVTRLFLWRREEARP